VVGTGSLERAMHKSVRTDFDDDVVVITGGSTGLGRAIAVEVAARGAKVVIINYSRNVKEAENTADLVRSNGALPIPIKADVSQDSDCRAIADAARPFGRINALFNNAGITVFAEDHSNLDAVSGEDFLNLYRVNVIGAYQMIRAARQLLEASDSPAAVVNTSSIAGIRGIGSSIPYAASKGALNIMTLSLARALAPAIRVNAICPGFIDTPWHGSALAPADLEQLRSTVVRVTPLQAVSSAEDVAVSAVFLASPDSRHITGETLIVDAGFHLGALPRTIP
jgi:3-oxoacyl-[acyl-carrier protein] reductase